MLDKLIPLGFQILEVMFFVGAAGCVLAVLIAWIEIFSDGFRNEAGSKS